MAIPLSLHCGRNFARYTIMVFCASVISFYAVWGVLFTFDEYVNGGEFCKFLVVAFLLISFFYYPINTLVLPEAEEWFRAKKMLSIEASHRRAENFKMMRHRIISSKAFATFEKWYMWIAIVFIAICFVIIVKDLFTPIDIGEVRRAHPSGVVHGREHDSAVTHEK